MKQRWGKLLRTYACAAAVAVSVAAILYPQAAPAQGAAALERRLQEMEREMRMLRQELQQMKAEEPAQTQQVQQLQDRVTKVETTPPPRKKNNLVFFRGGYLENPNEGRGFESFTDTHQTLIGLTPKNDAGDNGWYVGASIEHSMTDNLWGLWPRTEALAEIGLEWKRFGSADQTVVVPTAECALLFQLLTGGGLGGATPSLADGNCAVTGHDTITMFTVSAAPKIKFMDGSKLRPWIIPAGLDFHVISPPSDSASYLDVGVQFGAGLEYEFIPGLKLGIDGRYHMAANETNTENNFVQVINRELAAAGTGLAISGNTTHDNDFWTIGGYLGFTF